MDNPRTGQEQVAYLIPMGYGRAEAQRVASICFGASEGCCMGMLAQTNR